MEKKFAIILSGCGVYDGSEIHEAVTLMLAIKNAGHSYYIFAPDMELKSVNHLTGKEEGKRNVLVESARIARGDIKNLKELNPAEYDAIVMPGGFGAAKNLSDYAYKGAEFSVLTDLENILNLAHEYKKPIGAMCISPVILAKIFSKASVTVGGKNDAAADIEKIGGNHIEKGHGEVVIDNENRLVTTPCYMLNSNIAQVYAGAENLVKSLLSLM